MIIVTAMLVDIAVRETRMRRFFLKLFFRVCNCFELKISIRLTQSILYHYSNPPIQMEMYPAPALLTLTGGLPLSPLYSHQWVIFSPDIGEAYGRIIL